MPKSTSFQFGLPRFQGAVRYIVLLTLGIWVTIILFWAFDKNAVLWLLSVAELDPAPVLHGQIWRLLTFSFLHIDPRHVIFALIGVYFIGSSVEERTGAKAFVELYLFSSIVAGFAACLLALTGHIGMGAAYGAGAAVNGVFMVFYLFNRGTSIFLIPFPFQIPVLWVVVVIGGIETAYFILSNFALFYLVQLLGLGTGYLWYRFMWRRMNIFGFVGAQLLSFQNSYHRWKRRRAGKKFQVYMKKHNQDAKDYFDEYGNFRPPDDKDKKNGGSTGGGWVN